MNTRSQQAFAEYIYVQGSQEACLPASATRAPVGSPNSQYNIYFHGKGTPLVSPLVCLILFTLRQWTELHGRWTEE